MQRFWKRLRLTLDMIKFEHSVFALPFALTGALLAVRDSGFAIRAMGHQVECVAKLADERKDDQARVGTPGRAARDGADFIVVGRSVTGSDDPRATLAKVLREIADAGR